MMKKIITLALASILCTEVVFSASSSTVNSLDFKKQELKKYCQSRIDSEALDTFDTLNEAQIDILKKMFKPVFQDQVKQYFNPTAIWPAKIMIIEALDERTNAKRDYLKGLIENSDIKVSDEFLKTEAAIDNAMARIVMREVNRLSSSIMRLDSKMVLEASTSIKALAEIEGTLNATDIPTWTSAVTNMSVDPVVLGSVALTLACLSSEYLMRTMHVNAGYVAAVHKWTLFSAGCSGIAATIVGCDLKDRVKNVAMTMALLYVFCVLCPEFTKEVFAHMVQLINPAYKAVGSPMIQGMVNVTSSVLPSVKDTGVLLANGLRNDAGNALYSATTNIVGQEKTNAAMCLFMGNCGK